MTLREDIEAAFKSRNEVYSQLNHENDRVAAICAHAYFEATLIGSIQKRFISLPKATYENVFDRILQSFAANVNIAHAMGFLDEEPSGDLRKVNKVRNEFAHTFHPISFDRPDVLEYTSKLKTPDTHYMAKTSQFGVDSSRGKYLTTLWCIKATLGKNLEGLELDI